MLIIKPSKIYISSANVDMRKSIDGLAFIVEQKFALNPLSDIMFVFHNRHCDKIKILYWDGNGFRLLYKRIEKGTIYREISKRHGRLSPCFTTALCHRLCLRT